METITKADIKEKQFMEDVFGNRILKSRTTAFYKANYTKWVRIKFTDMMYIDTASRFPVRIVFKDGKIIHSNEPLSKISFVLPVTFERIHRSCIVNVEYVDYVDYRKKQVVLKNKEHLKLGLAYMENLEKYFI